MAPVEPGWYPGHQGTAPMLRPWEGPPSRVRGLGLRAASGWAQVTQTGLCSPSL